MANILSLAMKINADASGFKLDPVQRALQKLADEGDRVSSVFDQFAESSEAAARAQEATRAEIERLTRARQDGSITAKEFAEQFAAVESAANKEAAALRRAAQITEANLTPLQRYDRALEELNAQLQAGRISQETYGRAAESAARGLSTAERAARGLEIATEKIDDNAGKTKLQFNELSGIFSALPGPLGNIAGRISGISSAGEGLARVFSGGLSQGISGVGSAVAALVNPFTVAAGAVTAFGAAAVAVTQGLIALEDRVEKLGNTADKLGLSFEFIQVLDEAARRSGTSIDAVSAAFGRLQRSVLGVDEESKAAQKALAEIGVTAEDLQRLNPQEQYILIGQSLAGIEDPARRTATAVALFGRAGADLIPFFNNIKGAADDFERVGNALSEAQRRDIDAFGASMDRLSVATRGAKEQLLAEFAPAATQTANTFANAAGVVSRNSGLIANALSAVVNNFTGGLPAALSGVNAAVSRINEGAAPAADAAAKAAAATQALTDEVQSLTEEEIKQAKQRGEFLQGFRDNVSQAIDESAKFGQAGFDAASQYQKSIDELQRQFDKGILNETSFKREADKAKAVFNDQLAIIKDSVAQTEAITKRVDGLLAKANEIPQLEQNLNAVEAEIARVEAAAVAARGVGRGAEADALTRRLAELDQLQAGLQQQADEAAQGFSEGFDAAFANVNNGIGSLIDKASEFGQEGFNAALQLQDGIAKAQEQVKDGILNKQAFDAEVARQKELFENRVADLRRAEEITKRISEQQQQLADRQFEIELERAQELATVRSGSIQINDLREGGISAFFDALKEDPAISEARKQTKELENIRRELAKLQAEKVDILAGTG